VDLSDEKIKTFLGNLKVIKVADGVGGAETLVELPNLMSHRDVPQEMKEEMD